MMSYHTSTLVCLYVYAYVGAATDESRLPWAPSLQKHRNFCPSVDLLADAHAWSICARRQTIRRDSCRVHAKTLTVARQWSLCNNCQVKQLLCRRRGPSIHATHWTESFYSSSWTVFCPFSLPHISRGQQWKLQQEGAAVSEQLLINTRNMRLISSQHCAEHYVSHCRGKIVLA